jgi:hypothetical protein
MWVDEGITEGGWSFGDAQHEEDITRTYVHQAADGTWKIVNDCYAVMSATDDGEGPYWVDSCIEFLRCTDRNDPGGTELESDIQHDDGSYLSYESLEDATAEAMRLASIDIGDMIVWGD